MMKKKTEKKYWDSIWKERKPAKNIQPELMTIRNNTNRMFHEYFKHIFSSIDTNNLKLLEVGCANSTWLPYFKKEFGFSVTGLDYSEIGCSSAQQNLKDNNVTGNIVCADLFSPPQYMVAHYDIVISFGVVEHFDDTAACLLALSGLLKKGGLLITNIPNMSGGVGLLQKYINRPIYDIHNPLNRELFCHAHKTLNVEITKCDYFMSTNFGICNLNGVPQKSMQWALKKSVLTCLAICSMLIWLIEKKIGTLPVTQLFSPYINCVAVKK